MTAVTLLPSVEMLIMSADKSLKFICETRAPANLRQKVTCLRCRRISFICSPSHLSPPAHCSQLDAAWKLEK